MRAGGEHSLSLSPQLQNILVLGFSTPLQLQVGQCRCTEKIWQDWCKSSAQWLTVCCFSDLLCYVPCTPAETQCQHHAGPSSPGWDRKESGLLPRSTSPHCASPAQLLGCGGKASGQGWCGQRRHALPSLQEAQGKTWPLGLGCMGECCMAWRHGVAVWHGWHGGMAWLVGPERCRAITACNGQPCWMKVLSGIPQKVLQLIFGPQSIN